MKRIITLLSIVFLASSCDTPIERKQIAEETKSMEKEMVGVAIGQVLKTEYFDVTVNKVQLAPSVKTGNQYSDLKAEDGIKYLMLDVSFKNTDNESRMITDGSIWINYNGKMYEYDKAETVMAEGFGTMLDQINPLTAKRTVLVYKLPAEITGETYFQPGRAKENEVIVIGNIDSTSV